MFYYYKSKKHPEQSWAVEEEINDKDLVPITEEEHLALCAASKNRPVDPKRAIRKEIAQLKSKLSKTDYVVIKIAEGVATDEEYSSVLADRVTWRARINELEGEL